MMIQRRWLLYLVVGLIWLWVFGISDKVQGQTAVPANIVINFAAAEEQAESVALNIYFTVIDGNGRPISNPNLDTATIRLLDGEGGDFPAIVEDPVTPIYITLVMDASGSMSDIIEDARTAAQAAIDNAPPNAYFAVVQFNEGWELLEDFSNDPNRVKAAIARVTVANRGTCLYDTVYDAIDLLDRQIQNPQDRRAIILFTDGKDQLTRDSDAPCSRFHNNRDVTEHARSTGTPIHTIGLYDNTRANLNEAELRTLAAETTAFSALGGVTDLNDMFQEIMDGLNSQLVARVNVLPTQGINSAVLTLTSRDTAVPLNATFTFSASRTYNAPPPLAQFIITSVQYDATANLYRLSLSIANPQSVASVVANAWDTRGGTQISRDYIFPSPGPSLTIEIETTGFESGRGYTLRVLGLNAQGSIIQDEEGNLLQAESEVEYERPGPTEVTVAIQSVNAEYTAQQLIIDLELSNPGLVQTYDGFVVDEATGQRIFDFGPTPFTNPRLLETLPEAIGKAATPGTYRVTVYVNTSDNQRLEATYDEFSPIPPEQPGLISRMMVALKANPLILGAIVVILVAVVGWLMLKNRSEKKKQPAPVRPPIEKTQVFMPPPSYNPAADDLFDDHPPRDGYTLVGYEDEPVAPPATPRLQLQVMQTPGMLTEQQKVVQTFPFLIGREGCDFNITGDMRVSRRHLRFTLEGRQIFMTDLGSANGTFLDGVKLEANRATAVTGTQRLRLGTQTELELRLQP